MSRNRFVLSMFISCLVNAYQFIMNSTSRIKGFMKCSVKTAGAGLRGINCCPSTAANAYAYLGIYWKYAYFVTCVCILLLSFYFILPLSFIFAFTLDMPLPNTRHICRHFKLNFSTTQERKNYFLARCLIDQSR